MGCFFYNGVPSSEPAKVVGLRTGNFQSKAFSITAPAVWNLSPVTKSSATITTFKAHLKTEIFAAA